MMRDRGELVGGGNRRDQHGQDGQATIEFALVIPLVAIMLLLIVQGGLVIREQVMLINGVRQAARAAAVDPSTDTISVTRAASGLPNAIVDTSNDGTDITVHATAAIPIVVPGLRAWRSSIEIEATATMRNETG
jgi:Flp pilus assembly protein TadG